MGLLTRPQAQPKQLSAHGKKAINPAKLVQNGLHGKTPQHWFYTIPNPAQPAYPMQLTFYFQIENMPERHYQMGTHMPERH
eukprot:1159453-Pelagomonas_calceolata.AAC.6